MKLFSVFKTIVSLILIFVISVHLFTIHKENKNITNPYPVTDRINDLLIQSLQIQVMQLHYQADCTKQIVEQLDEYGKADFPCVISPKYDHNKQELQKIQWKIEVLEGQLKDETK